MSAADDPTGSQIRGSTLLLAGQVFAAVANLGAQILIVRYLTQQDFGEFAYALSVMLVAETAAGFGMRRGVARYMPVYEERGEAARAAGTLLLALSTVTGIGLVVVLIVAGFRDAIAGSISETTTAVPVLVILIALAPIQALSTILDGVFAVYSKPRAIAFRKYVLIPTFRLIVVGLLIFQSLGVVFLAASWVLTGLIGLLIYLPLVRGLLSDHGLFRIIRERTYVIPTREVMGFVTPLLSTDLIGALMSSGGPLILGIVAAAADVAEFRAVLPVVLSMSYVFNSFALLLIPKASRLYAKSEPEALNDLYWRTAAWTGVLAFPIFAACIAVPETISVAFFGEQYRSAAPVLGALAVGQFVSTAAGHNVDLLTVFGRTRFITISNFAVLPVAVALMVGLSIGFDAVGTAVGTSLAFIILNLVRQIGLARRTSVHGLDRLVTLTYGAMLAATALILGLRVVVDPPDLINGVVAVISTLAVLAVARHSLALVESFPQLGKNPLLRRILGGPAAA